jgi:hypothetical protein
MWKLLFLARRGWKLIPREQRRRMLRTARSTARKHGPSVAKAAGSAIRQARKPR